MQDVPDYDSAVLVARSRRFRTGVTARKSPTRHSTIRRLHTTESSAFVCNFRGQTTGDAVQNLDSSSDWEVKPEFTHWITMPSSIT